MDKKWLIKDNKKILDMPDINSVVLRLLTNRGFSAEQIKNFLAPDYKENLHDPFKFRDMKNAVELINKHLREDSRLVVYGDYDADGVTASAILVRTLEFLSVETGLKPAPAIDVYLPDRVTEGYGLKKEAIQKIAEKGASLIITVDNGIRNVQEVELTKKLGMDVIITDHHECGDQLPDCLIIDAKVDSDNYPFKELAGVGVAFKLAQALLSNYCGKNVIQNISSKAASFEKWLLDLVAIGTIADLVPLVDENRILAKYGLVVLNKTRRLGLQKLIEIAQSDVDRDGNKKEIDAWQVGFQLGPRLNAAGRLDHANSAYQLLVTEDEREAVKIAKQLNATNVERQNITQNIFAEADKNIDEQEKILFAVAPSLSREGGLPRLHRGGVKGSGYKKNIAGLPDHSAPAELSWPSGVMGLVAGKLTEKYYRPSLAITDKNGEIVGSARSVSEFHITEMLEECGKFLVNFGGHKQAAGFTVKPGMLDKFLAKAKEIAETKLRDIELAPAIDIDLEINLDDVDEDLDEVLKKLKPFGVSNPQPKFISKNLQVMGVKQMGAQNQHIKLQVSNNKSQNINAIAFSIPEKWKNIKVGDKIDMVYYIDMNEWNGRSEIQLKIIDLKIC